MSKSNYKTKKVAVTPEEFNTIKLLQSKGLKVMDVARAMSRSDWTIGKIFKVETLEEYRNYTQNRTATTKPTPEANEPYEQPQTDDKAIVQLTRIADSLEALVEAWSKPYVITETEPKEQKRSFFGRSS